MTPAEAANKNPAGPRPATVISYATASSKMVYGLPPREQQLLLAKYRSLWRKNAEPWVSSLDYDLCCHYYKNVHATEAQNRPTRMAKTSSESLMATASSPPTTRCRPWSQLPRTPPQNKARSNRLRPRPFEHRFRPPPPKPSTGGPRWGLAGDRENVDVDAAFVRVSSESTDGVNPSNLPLSTGNPLSPGNLVPPMDGVGIETAWSRRYDWAKTGAPLDGPVGKEPSVDTHPLRIISLQAYAFVDHEGHIVIKKRKTLLIPLN
ncbi:hypothetical protein C8F04DRAFT_1196588 [Mycena alexandri]|uniref:Uncharacterized protein n=1 Tax=Mycena alexandri TaxID=1745969 RepID=A0AAD6S7D7_9AGAR|nr:hypothetical protein C8F04DRAFT_1196588 [Mycena alexandri]